MQFEVCGRLSRLDGFALVHLHRLLPKRQLLVDGHQIGLQLPLLLLQLANHLVLGLHLRR
jgi:hypothetical protein